MKTKIINFFKWIWTQLKDKRNLLILIFVVLFMTSPTWVCGILGFIFRSNLLIGIAGSYILFWMGPLTPFWPLAISITLLIRKCIEKFNKKHNTTLNKKDKHE